MEKEDANFKEATAQSAVLIEEKVSVALKSQIDSIVKVFAGSNAASRFDASADHALYLLNGPEVAKWLAAGQDMLLDQLLKMDDNQALVSRVFLTIYSRKPSDPELKLAVEFLSVGEQGREEAVRELVRTLLCSAEFRFNK